MTVVSPLSIEFATNSQKKIFSPKVSARYRLSLFTYLIIIKKI